jgi:hypothetical protein
MSAALKKYEGWIRTLLTILFVCGLSFLDRRFASAESLEKTVQTLNAANTAIALLQQQAGALIDHEARIRDNTKTISLHESRLAVIERTRAATAMAWPDPDDYLLSLSTFIKE